MKCKILSTFFFAALIAVVCPKYLYSSKGLPETTEVLQVKKGPWFTGPLLTPSGYVVPVGFANIEPYIFVTDTFARYNSQWKSRSIPRILSISNQNLILVGITSFMDVITLPQWTWREAQDQSATGFNDLPIGVGFQLLSRRPEDWWPSIKVSLIETFPTGRYQKLNPEKVGLDATGMGAYITTVVLIAARLFHIHKDQFLSARFGMNYGVASKVLVKGFNTYGGGYGTRGSVYPGNSWNTLLGLEYSLTLNWVLAMDVLNAYTNKTRFKGMPGTLRGGTEAKVGQHSSNQISLAPAIEYNFSESLGIIAGCWFTVAGRNAPHFASGVIALNWYGKLSK